MQQTFAVIGPGDHAAFQQLLRIYQASIEISEQKPVDALAGLLADERYSILVALHGDRVDGFAILFFPGKGGPDESGFWLLEYMAVDGSARSRGTGAALLREAMALGVSRNGGPCVLEVDQSGAAVSPGNDTARRLRFYAEAGCRRLEGLNYILPLDVAGTPPPMQLLISGSSELTSLPASRVRDWLSIIYRDVYACSPQDPRIDTMMAPLGDRVQLVALTSV